MKGSILRYGLAALLVISAAAGAFAQGNTIDSLRRALVPLRQDTAGVALLNKLSSAIRPSDPRAGVIYAQQALALARQKDFKRGISQSWNTLGNAYLLNALWDSAQVCFEQALLVNREIGNRLGSAQNLGNLGNIAYFRSDFPTALKYLFMALRIFEELNDEEGITTQLGNIGSIYEQQGDYRAALRYDSLALQRERKAGDLNGQAIQLGNLGNIYDNIGQTAKALQYDSSAMTIYEALGDKEGVARNLSNLSQVFARLEDAPRMYSCLQRALSLYNELRDDNGLGTTYLNLGDFYLNRSRGLLVSGPIPGVPDDSSACLRLAIDFIQRAVAKHETTGNLAVLTQGYKALSKALKTAGRYREALDAFTRYKTMNDSVYAGDTKTQITNLETQRAVQLKDKQIELDRLAVAKKRNERGFFIVGIGLLVAVILVVFRNYRVQRLLNGALSLEKEKVERRTGELDLTNRELNTTLTELKETQQQLIIAEKQRENELIRSRISQDIHDDISSELTRISWVSELAKKKAAGADYGAVPGLLDKLAASSRETVTKLGEIIWTVNPHNDSLGSLLAYMRGHITKFFADTAFQYRIDFPETGTGVPINPELKRNLYLVMKEALNNAAKYSAAQTVAVSFSLDGERYRMTIADNGKGMEEGTVQGGGNGLGNMRRRMEAVQGSCGFSAEGGKGTTVSCTGMLY